MYKILIIEDDSALSKIMKKHIESWNYDVKCIRNFQNIIPEFTEFDPHLVLLDIMLPFFNGYHWCTELRKISNIPIVFVSSASDNMNIVMAMNMGGDDFISKPFDLTVLTAKISALIRRSYSYAGQLNTIENNGVILNLMDGTCLYNGEKTELSKNEFQILALLMENSGSVVSRDTIMMHLWDSENFIDDNTLTVNINRIRKKLKDIGLDDFVKTKKGLGYMVC